LKKEGTMDAREKAAEKIIVALDVSDTGSAVRMLEKLSPFVRRFKVGLSSFMGIGAPEAIGLVRSFNAGVFVDGKFHDTPKTVGNAVRALQRYPYIEFFTVHAAAGEAAIQEAAKEKGNAKLIAVTVLTSLNDWDAHNAIRLHRIEASRHFTKIAMQSGADGIVCGVRDLPWFMQEKDDDIRHAIKVVPGIRPAWYTQSDDQRNIGTPKEAITRGADFLVIGRPITNPPKSIGTPQDAFQLIVDEIAGVL